ncbi:MAG: von Willebrand factor type protein [Acidobacteria bacterium]|nr:von Willebrand factor type protein [Acidobacteriota bacterium]
MKRISIVSLCFLVFGLSVFAQSGRTSRPRVVTTPTPSIEKAPPEIQDDYPAPNTTKRPPVLQGGNNKSVQTQTAPSEDLGTVDDEVIKVETNLVTMPVSVLDRNGRFISGLRQEDFQIFENNAQQKIEYFASVEQPFTVVLLLDVSPSTAYQIDEIHDAAISFVNQLRREDKVVVIAFDERVRVLSPVTSDRNVLRNAIMQAQFGDGTSLYEAVDYTINRQLRGIEGRKAIVMFTDGVDTTSRRAGYQSTVRQAEELDAMIYPIRYDTYSSMADQSGGGYPYPRQRRRSGGTFGDILGGILNGGVVVGGGGYPGGGGSAGSSRADYEEGRRYLNDLAANSGGRTFEATTTSNLDAAFAGIAEELRRQYSVGYYPENVGQKGERRQIRVRVKRPNLVVRAKNSYIVGETSNQKLAGK